MVTRAKYSREEALLKLEAFCAYQERCKQELSKKMDQWGLTHDLQQELLQELEESGFLNEKRFAETYTSGKIKIKRWGRNKIIQELKQKGISDEYIHSALEEIDEEIYLSNIDTLVDRKYNAIAKGNEYEKRMKTLRYMYGKGYEAELVNVAIDKLIGHKL